MEIFDAKEDRPEIWYYEGGYWHPGGAQLIGYFLDETAQNLSDSENISDVLRRIRGKLRLKPILPIPILVKADNNGEIYYVPSQPVLNKESNAFKKPSLSALLGLSSPLLSPSTSGWSSDQNNEGTDAPKTSDASDTSGTLYTDKRATMCGM